MNPLLSLLAAGALITFSFAGLPAAWFSRKVWVLCVLSILTGVALGAIGCRVLSRKGRGELTNGLTIRGDGKAQGKSAGLDSGTGELQHGVNRNGIETVTEILGDEKDFVNSLIETAQATVLILDPVGNVRLVNRFFEQISGYRLSELQGVDWFETCVAEGEREKARKVLQHAQHSSEVLDHVGSIITRDGALRLFSWRWRVLHGPEGSARGVLGLGTDLTEREGMEEALQKSERRYRAIVEDQTELISRFRPDGTLTFVNGAYSRYFGEEPDLLLGNKFWHHVPKHEQERLKKHISRLKRDNPVSTIEHPVKTPEGIRWQQWTDRAIFDDEGRVVELQAVGRDITERKRVEQALSAERSRLYSVLDSLPVFVFLHSADFAIRFANRCFLRTFGEGAGQRCYAVLQGRSEPCNECRSREVLMDQRPQSWEWPADRIRRTFQMYSYPFTDADDTPLVLQLGIDMTDQKRNELDLRQSEARLRELSSRLLTAQEEERQRIAAELHDSIGSSLTGITVFLQSLVLRTDEGSPLVESIQRLISVTESTIQEARRIMSDLRPSMLDDLGIVKTLEWFCREFQQLHPGIHIERQIEIDENEIPEALKIILFRLVQEAFHNVAKHSRAEYVTLSLHVREDRVVLAVEDNGDGFAMQSSSWEESLKKGLGLTSMRERTELSGGRFTLESNPGEGTTVRAEWPKSPSADSSV